MARNQVSRRPRRRDKALAAAQAKQLEAAAQDATRDEEVGMLPRLLVRVGVVAVIIAFVAVVLALGATPAKETPAPTPARNLSPSEEARVKARVERKAAARPTVDVLAKYPHDTAAFTQGFTVVNRGHNKIFIESTGLYGESSLRHVDIESGKVLKQYDLPKELFGEGVTAGPNDELVMLTWKSKTGLVFDLDVAADSNDDGFTLRREFAFDTVTGEGWGITYDGEEFVVSDGSSTLMFWDPATMEEVRSVDVSMYDGAQKISQINELEFAKGFIYANVWYHPYVLKIDPETGGIVTMFDLSKLVADAGVDVSSGAVLNGIAYDAEEDVFYITGKLWGAVYKVRLVDPVQ
ncbi:Glutamine cyclotransferase [Phytophthora cinnamomi]|uniref:Glutamine cyclotransferase n=1 Tax=Phytophthora cinnamomi TaxID=4785 RepID=UPI00355A6A14|nr:Glutamine cyclotransferase [Phytophthora cinnamomi]